MRVLRILTSLRLPCGCLVGVYELYSGEVVNIVDEHEAKCSDPLHRKGRRIERAA